MQCSGIHHAHVFFDQPHQQRFHARPAVARHGIQRRHPAIRIILRIKQLPAQLLNQRAQTLRIHLFLRLLQTAHKVVEKRERVRQPLPARPAQHTCLWKRATTLAENHQRRRQVAAVYRRDIARRERLQAARVVPVEKVAAVTFQPRQAFKG